MTAWTVSLKVNGAWTDQPAATYHAALALLAAGRDNGASHGCIRGAHSVQAWFAATSAAQRQEART